MRQLSMFRASVSKVSFVHTVTMPAIQKASRSRALPRRERCSRPCWVAVQAVCSLSAAPWRMREKPGSRSLQAPEGHAGRRSGGARNSDMCHA
ncbi:hypothetical protein DIE15_03755 [Burkholderia sp. Bp9031]|nr:hypothetical protein DIE15_03755 [Burkholderia sp. Bp9031]